MAAAKPSVYVETTIPSYLAARPSRDLIVAAHQQVTWEWWQTRRQEYELFVSTAVIGEIGRGDPEAAARRLGFVDGLPVLQPVDEIRTLATAYERELGLAPSARTDLVHLAYAVLYETDYLVTWNCTHLANGHVIRRLVQVNADASRFTPTVVTPDVLLARETGEVP
ncbi:MAG: type II toxin-antitoxin system VapC family toxin [Planctomycetota bacterium]